MLNSDFEKQMQQKMEELRFTPDDAVWEKVEAGLPKKKKNRRFVFFILPLLALFCGSVLLWNHFTPSEKIANNKPTSTLAGLLGSKLMSRNFLHDANSIVMEKINIYFRNIA